MDVINSISKLCLIVLSMLVMSGCTQTGSIKVTLKGEVIDRPQSSQLLLLKQGETPTNHDVVQIPINNGRFEYTFNCKHEEKYQLMFYEELEKHDIRLVDFFSEHGIINFKLYPSDQFKKNIVEGGKLNREYQDYLFKAFDIYDAEEDEIFAQVAQYLKYNYSEVLQKHDALENDIFSQIEQLIEEGYDIYPKLEAIQDSVYQKRDTWKLQFVQEHPSIVGYSILVSSIEFYLATRYQQQTIDITPYLYMYQNIFAPRYPNHPYTEQMIDFLSALSFRAGVPFIDFIAVDFDSQPVRLSEQITGKPSLLHLWASWCGPCIRDGIELIPVYEEFRDKGFVIIGVARERGTAAAAQAAVNLHNYPWKNLVELDDVGQVWNKYGMGGAGGCKFLIDEKGIIVAINPSVDEIRNFLTNSE